MRVFFRFLLVCALAGIVAGCGSRELPSVTVFVTADIEGVFWSRPEPRYGNEVTGGLAILKSFLAKQNTPFLLLEGGNWFSQTPEGTLSQGEYFNKLTTQIPYTARLFTAKDLIYGWGSLSHIVKTSAAPFVLTNVTLTNGRLPAGAKTWQLEQVGDYKIGLVGLISPDVLKDHTRLDGLHISDPIASAQQAVQTLREKGAQAIIVLSALGLPENKETLKDSDLAEEVPGIDVIISSNMDREEPDTSRMGKTLLVYPGSRLDSVGKLQLFFNKNSEVVDITFEDVVLYRRDFGEDSAVAQEIETMRRATRNQMTRSVGKSGQELVGRLDEESALGDWAADCLRKWAKTEGAVLNSSSLRAPLPAGEVTQYDLYNLYPYQDNITYLTIKGKALQKALEESLNVTDNFAQISGLKIHYRPDAPAGRRITSVQINGKPLIASATYRVAVTDYMLAGGAGHDGFIDSLEFKNTQVEMRTVLRLCLAGNKPVHQPEGNRWSAKK